MTSEEKRTPRDYVTLQDIAERCQVNKVTVSRALRGDRRYVSAVTSARILAVAQELGYDPSRHHAARSLRLQGVGQRAVSQLVAVFFPVDFHSRPYYLTLFQGLLDVLQQRQYGLVTLSLDEEVTLPPAFRRGDIDGVIAIYQSQPIIDRIQLLRHEPMFGDRPIVSMMESIPGCSSVSSDDFAGGYAAAAHLLDLGHRHLLHFVQVQDQLSHRQRYAGYLQAFHDRGVNPAAHLHRCEMVDGGFSFPDPLEAAVPAALRQHPQITGILARHDRSAQLLAQLLERFGIAIPAAMSLIGYDDTDPIIDRQGCNILTTISNPLRQVGQRAANLLLDRLTGILPGDQLITLPVELVQRVSTAPPRT